MKLIAAKVEATAQNEELKKRGFVAAYVQSCSQCRVLYRVFYKEADEAHDTIAQATFSIDRAHPEHTADVIDCVSKALAKDRVPPLTRPDSRRTSP